MYSCTDSQAVCRGCGKHLDGSPYFKGGRAYDPVTRKQARFNYYGGHVCSRECDFRASLELEQDMPGHGWTQKRPGREAMARIESNWPEN